MDRRRHGARSDGAPLPNFKPGLFEPNDLNDSTPLSLFLQCAVFIVKNPNLLGSPVKFPAEVGDKLLEVFQSLGCRRNTSTMLKHLNPEKCRIHTANFNKLEVTSEELLDFVGHHSKTLQRLDISDVKDLSTEALLKLVDKLVRVSNPERLHREVTVYHMNELDTTKPMPTVLRDSEFIWKKVYHNGLMTSYTKKNMPKEFIHSILGDNNNHKEQVHKQHKKQPQSMEDGEDDSSNAPPKNCGGGDNMDVDENSQQVDTSRPNYPHVVLKNPANYDVTHTIFEEPLLTDYDLHEAMGLFKQPDYVTCYIDACSVDANDVGTMRKNLVVNKDSKKQQLLQHQQQSKESSFDLYCDELVDDIKKLNNIYCNHPAGSSSTDSSVSNYHLTFDNGHRSISSASIDEEDGAPGGAVESVPTTSGNFLSNLLDGNTPPQQSVNFGKFSQIVDQPTQDSNVHSFQESNEDNAIANKDNKACVLVKTTRRSNTDEGSGSGRSRNLATVNGRHSLSNDDRGDGVAGGEFDHEDEDEVELNYQQQQQQQQQSPPPQPSATAPLHYHHQQSTSSQGRSADLLSPHSDAPGPSGGSSSSCALGTFDTFCRRLNSNIHGQGVIATNSTSCPSLANWVFYTIRTQEQMRSQLNKLRIKNNVNKSLFYDFSNDLTLPAARDAFLAMQRQQREEEEHRRQQPQLRWPQHSSQTTGQVQPPGEQPQQQQQPPATDSASSSPDIYFSHELADLGFEGFKSYEYSVFKVEKYICVVEIRTWEECPLETVVMGDTAMPRMDLNDLVLRTPLNIDLFLSPHLVNLRRVVVKDWPVDVLAMLFPHDQLDRAVANRLEHLDFSGCQSIGTGDKLLQMSNLKSLVLHNVDLLPNAWDNLCKLKSLRHLDISNLHDSHNTYDEPNNRLQKLVEGLPKLMSLDISGTNLAGFRAETITGLQSRTSNPLEFLGLLHTNHEACYRQNIPALNIAGDSFENYILTACEAYMERVDLLRKSLNELFQLFRYESGKHNLSRALKILVCALGKHPADKLIQVAASATLFYIVKSDEAKMLLGKRMKQLIVSRLLDAMQTFRYDQTMLRNGCLNLIHFRIPQDVISEYTRLADILLYIVTNDEEDFVQRLGIYLLNSLACQVDGEQKTIVGDLGAIEKMLQLIEARFNRNVCDEVMETAWSTMWNVTDETPVNCERFLNANGMDLFVSCMDRFPNYPELLRNMMGLLGNVSECPHLRYRLMKGEYIIRFIRLLDSTSDGIEVSYNSAGILAHIASDGTANWDRYLDTASNREEMLRRMEIAISRWEINSKRNINYRSFEPILRLLQAESISWQAQYWAVWALANLTRVHCSKYCQLLEKDGGIKVLRAFIGKHKGRTSTLPKSAKCLAVVTLLQYFLYKNYGNLRNLDKCPEIMCFYRLKGDIVQNFLKDYDLEEVNAELNLIRARRPVTTVMKVHKQSHSNAFGSGGRSGNAANDWYSQLNNMHQHRNLVRFNSHLMHLREMEQRQGLQRDLEVTAESVRLQHQRQLEQRANGQIDANGDEPPHEGLALTCPACRLALAAGEHAQREARQRAEAERQAALRIELAPQFQGTDSEAEGNNADDEADEDDDDDDYDDDDLAVSANEYHVAVEGADENMFM